MNQHIYQIVATADHLANNKPTISPKYRLVSDLILDLCINIINNRNNKNNRNDSPRLIFAYDYENPGPILTAAFERIE